MKNTVKILTIIGAISLLFCCDFSFAATEEFPFLPPSFEITGDGYMDYLGGKIKAGYYVADFVHLDRVQIERVGKRNGVEKLINSSYSAGTQSYNDILLSKFLQDQRAYAIKNDIAMYANFNKKVAASNGLYYYVPYSDGHTEFFKDGLLGKVINERVVDEFGNLSLKNTYDMDYNDKRLLKSYNAKLTDELGNISSILWEGTYTKDSVFYGTYETNANKHLLTYSTVETDHAGNTTKTAWKANDYDNKFLRSYTESTENSVYGKTYFTRSNIQYDNPKYMLGYHEEGQNAEGFFYSSDRSGITYNDRQQIKTYNDVIKTKMLDGNVETTFVEAQFNYITVPEMFGNDIEKKDPNRLAGTSFVTKVLSSDGAEKSENSTTTYVYNDSRELIDGYGSSEFIGREGDWTDIKDAQGHTLAVNKDENGNDVYSYQCNDTKVIVPADQVIMEEKRGNGYKGSSNVKYQILFGKPMVLETSSTASYYGRNMVPEELLRTESTTLKYENGLVNNFRKVLTTKENSSIVSPVTDPENLYSTTREINSTYIYSANGNLKDVVASGEGSGWEYEATKGWYGHYISTISEEFDIILGKPVKVDHIERKEVLED